MTKRISIIGIGILVVVIIVMIVLLTTQNIFNLTGTKDETDNTVISTALLERKDLRTFEKIEGVLEYGSEVQVLPSSNGILTYIVDEGEDVLQGTLLFKYYKSVTETEIFAANSQIASADSAVAQAEALLEALISGPTEAQIASADSAVAQAEALLEALISGPTEAQIASADSAVAQAESTLVTSNSLLDTQWITFRIARQSYCDLSEKLGSLVWTSEVYKAICPDSGNAMTAVAANLLLTSIFDEPLLVTMSNELLIAHENYINSIETQIASAKALESAKAQRTALDEGPAPADLNNANLSLESAKAQRASLNEAPTLADLGNAQASLESAKAQRTALDEGPAPADLNNAQASLESAKAQRDALDEDPTPADLNNAYASLESAKASLKLAKHNRDELGGAMVATVVMYGDLPAWRSFEMGMSEGDDIYQLEQNLVALGYGQNLPVIVDRIFDENTYKAIQAMQYSLELPITGKLRFRDVLFMPGPSVVQYSPLHTELGAGIVTTNSVLGLIPIEKVIGEPGDAEITESLQKVSSSIEVVNQDLVDLGLPVSIELPDETNISGTISEIGEIAVIPTGNQGEPYLEIVISLDGAKNFPEWTGAVVTVSVTKNLASDVLAAPVTSLLAVLGGGYAIEIIENGAKKLVPVSTGLYADGYVEINGVGIKEGTEVVVP
ncbi:MAG: hypothetical protein FI698_04910 [SAR202 cluster bacterium]|nr:hypothetical protein [SAR202 cluster bacterium]